MAKVKQKKPWDMAHHWFLSQWMEAREISQADLCRGTDWSRAKASPLVNNEVPYMQEHLDDVSKFLGIEPWELLMSPKQAGYVRQMMGMAAMTPERFKPKKPDKEAPKKKQKSA